MQAVRYGDVLPVIMEGPLNWSDDMEAEGRTLTLHVIE